MVKKKLKFIVTVFAVLMVMLSVVSCNNNEVKKDDLLDNNVINIYKDEFYSININFSEDYSFEIENSSVIKIDKESCKIYGLQEGKSDLKIKSANGFYDECVVNVVSRDRVRSVDDIYALDENEMNFITLYVAENKNGIIRYVYNAYENAVTKPVPYFTETVLYTKEGVWSNESKRYEIISISDDISPDNLEYGDIIICHYDYRNSDVYVGPPKRNVYNLYYTGMKIDQDITL